MAEVIAIALTLPQARELQRAADAYLLLLTTPGTAEYNRDAARALTAAAERLHFVRVAHDTAAGRTPAVTRQEP